MFEKIINMFKEMYIAKQQKKSLEIQRKMDIANKQHELKLKRAELEAEYASKGKPLPDNLDRLSMEQMEGSYKDEIIMTIVFTPIVLVFIPFLQNNVKQGFDILSTSVPEWYIWLVVGIVVVTYGLRGVLKLLLSRKMGK
jgi:hypothetical protein